MNNILVRTIFLICFICGAAIVQSQTVLHDEVTDGDLSNDFANPTDYGNLGDDTYSITATQGGSSDDVDYISFSFNGLLSALAVTGYTATGTNNNAFIGIQEGTAFNQDAGSTQAADLLGGLTYGSGNLDTDILPAMGSLSGAIGFESPLPEGSYVLWLNQTGPSSTVTLTMEISPPASISESKLKQLINIYPNPVNDVLHIETSSTAVVHKTVIYNLAGSKVLTSESQETFSVTSLRDGVYFAIIETNLGSLTKKIIKQ